MLFFYSTLTVSTSQTSELLHFLKNRVGRSISLSYTFGEFLACKIFEKNPFKFVTNSGKGFLYGRGQQNLVYDPPSPFIELFFVNQSISQFIIYQKVKDVELALMRVLLSANITMTLVCGHSFQDWKLKKKSTDKKKN